MPKASPTSPPSLVVTLHSLPRVTRPFKLPRAIDEVAVNGWGMGRRGRRGWKDAARMVGDTGEGGGEGEEELWCTAGKRIEEGIGYRLHGQIRGR
eukprot:750649-Hanusia_phi.AAC.4